MNEAEKILQKFARKNMVEWNQESFKRTHSRLHKSIIEAINEALNLQGVVERSKIKLYIRTPFGKNEEYTICDEITDEVYASTGVQGLAIIIKNALEEYMNKTKKDE